MQGIDIDEETDEGFFLTPQQTFQPLVVDDEHIHFVNQLVNQFLPQGPTSECSNDSTGQQISLKERVELAYNSKSPWSEIGKILIEVIEVRNIDCEYVYESNIIGFQVSKQ